MTDLRGIPENALTRQHYTLRADLARLNRERTELINRLDRLDRLMLGKECRLNLIDFELAERE